MAQIAKVHRTYDEVRGCLLCDGLIKAVEKNGVDMSGSAISINEVIKALIADADTYHHYIINDLGIIALMRKEGKI